MLQAKESFLEYLCEVERLLGDFNCIEEIKNKKDEISKKELLVPVVGGFSAGKSTIINSLLGGGIFTN